MKATNSIAIFNRESDPRENVSTGHPSVLAIEPDAEQARVLTKVLTGRINTELVSLLNQERSDAIGVSGKDGGLLRARKLRTESGPDLGRVGEITSVNVALLWPSKMRTVAGIVTWPLPDCDRVTVMPSAPAGVAEVTVMVNESPARSDAVAGVKLSAGCVSTVSVVVALIEPGVAVMVVVPAARADTTPLALTVATV